MDWLMLLVALALSFGAAFVGGRATASSVGDWYRTLDKPPWTPPSWLFGPVWTVLYVAIAVSAWLVWREAGWHPSLILWLVQLGLNALWSILFFGRRNPRAALVDIVALDVTVVALIVWFATVSALAAWLLVPYLAWASFATALNASIVRRNPQATAT